MRDDVLAMIAWLERFVPDYARRRKKEHKETTIIIENAWFFQVSTTEKGLPFSVVRDFYNERKRIKQEIEITKNYDIREKTIKLTINSIYGQLARSVGDVGKVPFAANPWYAAATTAYSRRRLMEAGLISPHAIVFFATDGIVSTEELRGLNRVRKSGDDVELGDWEYCEANGGLFIQAGVYTYGKAKIAKDSAQRFPCIEIAWRRPEKLRQKRRNWRVAHPRNAHKMARALFHARRKACHFGGLQEIYHGRKRSRLAETMETGGAMVPPAGDLMAAQRVIDIS